MKQFITGGVKSGKSNYAQKLALESKKNVVYIATATAMDDEMSSRILQHQKSRPRDWELIEEPVFLAEVIEEEARQSRCLLVDCLTLWLTNLLLTKNETLLQKEVLGFKKILEKIDTPIILVANESNLGVTPVNALARRYCDEAGVLHQNVAALCHRVVFMMYGLPQYLKDDL